MEIEYQVGRDDTLRNAVEALKARKRSFSERVCDEFRKPIGILAAVLWFLIILSQYLIKGISLKEAAPSIAFWFAVITPALFLVLYLILQVPKYLVEIAVSRLPADHWGIRTAIITPEGITIKSDRKETKVKRNEIRDFIQTPNAIVAYGEKKALMIFPKEHFQLCELLEALDWPNPSR